MSRAESLKMQCGGLRYRANLRLFVYNKRQLNIVHTVFEVAEVRRKFIRTTFVLFRILSFAFVLALSEQVLAHPSPPPAPADDRNAALQIFAQVNQWRVQSGLWPLRWNNA